MGLIWWVGRMNVSNLINTQGWWIVNASAWLTCERLRGLVHLSELLTFTILTFAYIWKQHLFMIRNIPLNLMSKRKQPAHCLLLKHIPSPPSFAESTCPYYNFSKMSIHLFYGFSQRLLKSCYDYGIRIPSWHKNLPPIPFLYVWNMTQSRLFILGMTFSDFKSFLCL